MAKKTLLEHAAYELTRAGLTTHEDPEARKVAEDTMALVRRFVKQNHNETTGKYVLQFFEDILNFLPLTAITDKPDEWEKFTVDTKNEETQEVTSVVRWQSKRAPSFISEDEGKTWTDMKTGQTGTSVGHVKQEAAREEEERKKAKLDEQAKEQIAADEKKAAAKKAAKTKPAKETTDGEAKPQAKS